MTNMKHIFAEKSIDPNIVEESISNYKKMNDKQKYFCDDALERILGDTDEQFLSSLDDVAGTGKTFTLNVLIAKLLEAGKSVISAAFVGIAGTLLIGGSIFHSQTNAPLNPCKEMKLGIKNNSVQA